MVDSDSTKTAVLLMAYGTPNSIEEIEPYYTDIRGGRKPSPENLKQLVERYEHIGGLTPLLGITRAQASALESQLNRDGELYRVFVGMRHWHPYIAEAVELIQHEGLQNVIALALAPHYSRFSIDGYFERLRTAMSKCHASFDVRSISSWNVNPLFLRSIAERMQDARGQFGEVEWQDIQVIFSAHSLPERILQSHDPYPQQLLETCQGVAALIRLSNWRLAFQSAGRTGEKWLGPEINETLDTLASEGHKRVLIAPVGFVADHLEVLYDIDVKCAERAQALGLEMHRIASPNSSPTFIAALADVVRNA